VTAMAPIVPADAQQFIPGDGGTWVLVDEDSSFCDIESPGYAPGLPPNALKLAVVLVAAIGLGLILSKRGD